MKFTMAVVGTIFWTGYFLFNILKEDKYCDSQISNMYCPQDIKLAAGEILFYHTIAIGALAFCFIVALHSIFVMMSRIDLSITTMLSACTIVGFFMLSEWRTENFGFRCLGFLVGVYGAFVVCLLHLMVMNYQKKKLADVESDLDGESSSISLTDENQSIELRNNQPGCYFDLNTGTHICNFQL